MRPLGQDGGVIKKSMVIEYVVDGRRIRVQRETPKHLNNDDYKQNIQSDEPPGLADLTPIKTGQAMNYAPQYAKYNSTQHVMSDTTSPLRMTSTEAMVLEKRSQSIRRSIQNPYSRN